MNEEHSYKPEQKTIRKNRSLKGFISTLAAGVVGSALTLAVIPHTDYLNQFGQTDAVLQEQSIQSPIVPTKTSTTQTGETSIADMVENASKAIVGVVNLQEQPNRFSGTTTSVESGSGSGVIFKKTENSAYIITNNHVIEGAGQIEVSLANGERVSATLVGADALTDLAVLKINPKYVTTVIEFGDSATLRAGDEVLAIGNPLGLEFSRTVTQGIVSAVDRTISVSTSAGEWDLNVIQTDAAINPGNSGGALINTNGQVIGINSLKIAESGVEGLGFAIPSNDLLPIVNEMIETGQVERPYMGVSLGNLEEISPVYLQELPENVTNGVMVTYIDPYSSAAKAGLTVQDVIVGINDTEINDANELRKYLYSEVKVGDKVTVKVYRDGELKEVELTLTSKNEQSE
ncbi:S1C family serine protease [Cytobacillus sp. FJAT-54145]|uniref:S1C family serine protease n=1 Tax=Cytobacillus spartinae TaxID=3299023 RepID=A0ABW6KB61_9BACI